MGFKIQFLIVFFCVATATLSAEIGYQEPWGKDAELVLRQSRIPSVPTTKGIWTKLAEQVILFHQNVLSPVDGPRSHFRPTSSRYMLLAMRRHG
ncbi:MAG: membrane protein insertion efficiency factor YidD, partial [Simkania sp.]|nr:membrane protein insertion efficiency factor YidD [Simkania sp.]